MLSHFQFQAKLMRSMGAECCSWCRRGPGELGGLLRHAVAYQGAVWSECTLLRFRGWTQRLWGCCDLHAGLCLQSSPAHKPDSSGEPCLSSSIMAIVKQQDCIIAFHDDEFHMNWLVMACYASCSGSILNIDLQQYNNAETILSKYAQCARLPSNIK